ncbi:PREDICTED: uncharacterized protein LOC105972129 [Erythranthe guttata]|uniref:uncharacterized protein LOC105972129 n=1 Tax=Erythranthe guttata TaxID=4155 RepID=UPI00064DB194|nr:PREDICTED: uncharacterized protein LOC105972129 [Erythranthe guttata]|eukprot:XP_012852524.1 PREDICTED: uncharacterized protein LOC105972129 [Erythranthe guttata]
MAQGNESGKEFALYYLSRTLTENELRYSPVEKICLALFYAIKKLRHYVKTYSIRLISRADPVKFVISKPVLSGRLAKWSIMFNQYEITYVPQKSVEGQALANFLADHPIPTEWELSDDLPDKDIFFIEVLPAWEMFFDGASRSDGSGARVVFVSPEKQVLTYSVVLGELCSNNVVEYQALIIGLEMALEMNITEIEIYGDSKLIFNQLLKVYEVRKEELIPLCQHTSDLVAKFEKVVLNHIPRKDNRKADALANLATILALSEGETTSVPMCNRWIVPSFVEVSHEELTQHNSSMYNAAANGLVEAFNKTLCNLLKKVVSKSKKDWHERVGEALWAYRTTYRTATQATPYSLVYGLEAILSLGSQIPSLRIAIQEGLTAEDNARLRLEELEALDEKRLEAQQQLECYQARMSKEFNKKVRPRSFQVGDLVLAVRRPITLTQRMGNKFASKWDGPYVVKEAYTSGAYKLVDNDGLQIGPINGKYLKRYYP